MKKLIVAGLLLAGLACGCAPAALTNAGLPEAVLMKISCRDDVSLKQTILNQLRAKRAKDIMTDHENGMLYIQATFIVADEPLYEVQNLQTDIRSMAGMFTVELEWNKTGAYTSPSLSGHLPIRDDPQQIH